MSRYELYLNDILRAIEKIETSLKNNDEKSFSKDDNLIDATSMRLQIIGESINKLPEEIKRRYKKINWKKLSEIRNIISHAYFKINPKIIWSIIEKDIPLLKKYVLEIKNDLNSNEK